MGTSSRHAPSGCRFMGCALGSQSLKSPITLTVSASGAQQMKPTGLMVFLAEYRSGLRRKDWECIGTMLFWIAQATQSDYILLRPAQAYSVITRRVWVMCGPNACASAVFLAKTPA